MVSYASLVVLAAVLLGAVGVALSRGDLTGHVRTALCQIFRTSGNCTASRAAGPAPKPADVRPAFCVSSENSDSVGAGLTVAFVKLTNEFGIIRMDSREVDFDGKTKHYVYLTFVGSATLSATGSAGGKLRLGDVRLGEKVEIATGVTVNAGDIYRLTPAQADKLTKDISLYQAGKILRQFDQRAGGATTSPPVPKLPPVAITYGSAGTYVQAGTGGPGDKGASSGVGPTPASYSPSPGLNVTAKTDGDTLTERWNITPDGHGGTIPQVVTQYQSTGTISGCVNLGGNKGKTGGGIENGGSLTYSSAVRVQRDQKTGRLESIRYVIRSGDTKDFTGGIGGKNGSLGSSASHGRLHTQVVQINFTDDQQRRTGEMWLKNHGLQLPDIVAKQILTGDVADPGPDAPPLDRLIYRQGKAWQTQGDSVVQDNEIGLNLSEGLGFGGEVHLSQSQLSTQDARILGAPTNSRRKWIAYPDCTKRGNQNQQGGG